MKPNQKSPLIEHARMSGLVAATERARIEVTRFIDFIELHNPDIDRTTATLTAA
jgi:hypothetical protein